MKIPAEWRHATECHGMSTCVWTTLVADGCRCFLSVSDAYGILRICSGGVWCTDDNCTIVGNAMKERQDLWFRYDDVPNATEEELQQYPRILATFYQKARQSSRHVGRNSVLEWVVNLFHCIFRVFGLMFFFEMQGFPYMNGVRRLMELLPQFEALQKLDSYSHHVDSMWS